MSSTRDSAPCNGYRPRRGARAPWEPGLASHTVQVEVIRSPRRRKTVQASEADGLVKVWIPATMSRVDEERWVAEMLARLSRRKATEATDLDARARLLASRY